MKNATDCKTIFIIERIFFKEKHGSALIKKGASKWHPFFFGLLFSWLRLTPLRSGSIAPPKETNYRKRAGCRAGIAAPLSFN